MVIVSKSTCVLNIGGYKYGMIFFEVKLLNPGEIKLKGINAP